MKILLTTVLTLALGFGSLGEYPPMGRTMRTEFFFKDDFILFDHGAYGMMIL